MKTGTYRCTACNAVYDGSQVREHDGRVTCADAFCDANVHKISDEPKINPRSDFDASAEYDKDILRTLRGLREPD